MSKIKLVQSGGIGGKSRSAEMEISMTEKALYDALMKIRKGKNPQARDAFSYTAYAGDVEDGISISISKATGKLQTALNSLLKEINP